MPGTAMITFDCEGLWGMADHLTDAHLSLINGNSLRRIYDEILLSLDEFKIPATFSFVSLFATQRDIALELLRNVQSERIRKWSEAAKSGLEVGDSGGWDGSEVFSLVRQRGTHEIASHGWSHLPWIYPNVTPSDLDEECRGIQEWSVREGISLGSFVFPRNQVADVSRLANLGIKGYRRAPNLGTGNLISRLGNIVSEFRQIPSEQFDPLGHPVGLPGGFPINWRSGPRKVVPIRVSISRTAELLDHATKTDGVVHLWTHPHNLITGSRQVQLFRETLRKIADCRKINGLKVVTQRELIESRTQS